VTGFGILFFWVARMMMMGIHFTGKEPFHDVYIHALVRDPEGQKMSKSKGNVIDPLEVMEKHGTDAFRFTLAALAAQGRDIRLSEERVLGYRNFCNKIWNAARFVFSTALPLADLAALEKSDFKIEAQSVSHDLNRWILGKFSETIQTLRKSLAEYRFNDAAMAAYHFFWGTYCDWYLELVKKSFSETDPREEKLKKEFATVTVLVLEQTLRLMHPFIPFLTEELWQNIADRQAQFLATSYFPKPLSEEKMKEFKSGIVRIEALTAIVDKIRQIRMEAGVPLNAELKRASLYSSDNIFLQEIDEIAHYTINLTKIPKLGLNDPILKDEKGIARGITSYRDVVVVVDLKGVVDLEKEKQRQQKELARLQNGLSGTQKMLTSADFLSKAPEELVAEKKQAEADYLMKIQEVKEALELL